MTPGKNILGSSNVQVFREKLVRVQGSPCIASTGLTEPFAHTSHDADPFSRRLHSADGSTPHAVTSS